MPECEKCEEAIKRAIKVADQLKTYFDVRVAKVEKPSKPGDKFVAYNLPAIVVNGNLEFVGLPKEDALREKIEEYLWKLSYEPSSAS